MQYIRVHRAYLMPHWWHVLADTQAALQDNKQGALSYVQSAKQSQMLGQNRGAAWSMYQAAAAYARDGRHVDAVATAKKGIQMCKDTCGAELHWFLSFLEYGAGNCELAVALAHEAAARGCFGNAGSGSDGACKDTSVQQQQQHMYLPAWYELPYDVLRFAYRQLGGSAAADAAELNWTAAVAAREAAAKAPQPLLGVYELESIEQLQWTNVEVCHWPCLPVVLLV
jgi:hypothetical protein